MEVDRDTQVKQLVESIQARTDASEEKMKKRRKAVPVIPTTKSKHRMEEEPLERTGDTPERAMIRKQGGGVTKDDFR